MDEESYPACIHCRYEGYICLQPSRGYFCAACGKWQPEDFVYTVGNSEGT